MHGDVAACLGDCSRLELLQQFIGRRNPATTLLVWFIRFTIMWLTSFLADPAPPKYNL